MFLIALLIARDFLRPVAPVLLRYPVSTLAGVTVPETSMHENYLPARAEHQVRFSGQILSVQSVTETHAVHYPAHGHFRPGVLILDCTHRSTALLGSHCYDLPITVGSDSLCILALRVICVVRTVSGALIGHVESDVIDFLRPAAETVIERLHDLNVREFLRLRVWIIARTWNRRRQQIQTWWGQGKRPRRGFSGRIADKLRAWSADRAADHIPDHYAIYELPT